MNLKKILTIAWSMLIALLFISIGAVIFPGLDNLNRSVVGLFTLITVVNIVVSIGTVKYNEVKYGK